MQKILVFDYYGGKLYDQIGELNEYLSQGWKFVSQTAIANDNHILFSYVLEYKEEEK